MCIRDRYQTNIHKELTGYLDAMRSKEEKEKGIRMSNQLFKKAFKDYGCMKYFLSFVDEELEQYKTELPIDDFNTLRDFMFEVYATVPEGKELNY